MSSVPKSLEEYRDTIRTLSELEAMRESLEKKSKDFGLGMEIKFLDDQIDELNHNLDSLEKKTSKIFKLLLKQDGRAHFLARLNFHCGYKWEEIADMCNAESSESMKGYSLD